MAGQAMDGQRASAEVGVRDSDAAASEQCTVRGPREAPNRKQLLLQQIPGAVQCGGAIIEGADAALLYNISGPAHWGGSSFGSNAIRCCKNTIPDRHGARHRPRKSLQYYETKVELGRIAPSISSPQSAQV
jgi:hypothetical protein